jgi:glucose/arabinose dehydrogenase
MKRNLFFVVILILVLAVGVGFVFRQNIQRLFFRPTESSLEQGTNVSSESQDDLEVIAENLNIPWEIVFLPDGDMLVTERVGNLLRIGEDKKVIKVEGVKHVGEGGLLGLALHPNFSKNQFIYLYLTTEVERGLENRVERYRLNLESDTLSDKKIIIGQIPGSSFHDGGRIAFGPDNLLYITTGDAGNEELSQDTSSLAGKILRVKDDGSIPPDNPFGTAVYSYGHRNSQGITWDSKGNLWSTEHGRSGIASGLDELNFIEKGKNYGWPTIQGDESKEGMVSPVIQSDPDETWAPAAAAYLNNSVFFAGLRGESLYEAKISKEEPKVTSIKSHFRGDFGRLRAVVVGPYGFLYISTSNTDGRGNAKSGDDKIILLNPKVFD